MKSSSSSSLDIINIEARTQRLDVDNRFTLNIYFRIATNILKQAEIFRAEKNIIDLYVMLLRFSSLVSETIPCHRGYRAFPQSKKDYLRKNFLNALGELEQLKTAVQQRINELNRKHTHQVNGWGFNSQDDLLEKHPYNKKILNGNGVTKAVRPATGESLYQGSRTQQYSYVRPVEMQFRRVSLNFQRPNEETLSRHSILGPNGLNGQWQPPRTNEGVKYPSIIDLTPVEIPRLQESVKAELSVKSEHTSSEPGRSSLESILTVQDDSQKCQVQDLIPATPPQVSEAEHKMDISSPDDNLIRSEASLQLHISTALMENFMKMAKSNTDKNLETCGVLAGSLKNRKFYVTALIIPKQESTSDSCQTTNEEEIFEVQDKRSLFPLGWIHTHPTQSCFMSSIDVHTHYSYQIMLPEAVAIVMAPRDSSRTHGIFRLTAPGGMSVIRQCQHRGFHPHDPPPDGGPIYKTCTDVYMNPELKFDVIDLR
ncbi:AMSH-LIKE UBIQUITIN THIOESTERASE 1 [Salix purpurea]|uniref:AMSH-LIKE UBIQUITIN THIOESTERASE 1 n=1 Tax=Salix purpurea TaxID=77065 RepID=A0A9Q1A6L7_SALPP|nr:AMSH-LIKE UBIQUITIN THIOESTERASE 1 [Salix purpurea]